MAVKNDCVWKNLFACNAYMYAYEFLYMSNAASPSNFILKPNVKHLIILLCILIQNIKPKKPNNFKMHTI